MVRIQAKFAPLFLAVLGSLEIFVNAAAIASPPAELAPSYGQCGGNDYDGPTVCQDGYECVEVNNVYDQCIPKDMVPAHEETKRAAELEGQTLAKRQSNPSPPAGYTPIIGVQTACAVRKNIVVMQQTAPDEFNMLALAFESIMRDAETGALSWYGIAGIHGQPYAAWQGNSIGGRNMGYCVHGSPLFATWHRPYVMLMEQTVVGRARTIAATFPTATRSRYQAAADRLRLPYYDWADTAYGGSIPSFLRSSTLSNIFRPTSTAAQTIQNPFFQYNFRGGQGRLGGNYRTWQYTVRDPASTSATTTSNNGAIDTAMRTSFTTRRQNTFNLFSIARFNDFTGQCEGIHNGVHATIGGGSSGPLGHMGSTLAAAFDPIFWFHHCQVDRLIAMYQAVYYNSVSITPVRGVATYGRFVPSADGVDTSQDTADTRLWPFRRAGGALYTSRAFLSGTTGIWQYRYGYPEIPCGPSTLTTTQSNTLSANVRTAINRLYRPATGGSKKREAEALPEPRKKDGGYIPDTSDVGLVRKEYSARFFIDHSEIPGLWSCQVFMGSVPLAFSEYATSPSRCGIFSSFSAPGQRKESMPYFYELALTDQLEELKVPLNDDAVSTYLTKNFQYACTGENGAVIDPSNLKTFKVGICTREGKYGKRGSDKLASFGDCTILYKITEKKKGGIKDPKDIEMPTLLDGTPDDLTTKLETY